MNIHRRLKVNRELQLPLGAPSRSRRTSYRARVVQRCSTFSTCCRDCPLDHCNNLSPANNAGCYECYYSDCYSDRFTASWY